MAAPIESAPSETVHVPPVRSIFDVVPVQADGTFDLTNVHSKDVVQDVLVFSDDFTEQRIVRVRIPRATFVPVWAHAPETIRAPAFHAFPDVDLRPMLLDVDDAPESLAFFVERGEGFEIRDRHVLARIAGAPPLPSERSTVVVRAEDGSGVKATHTFQVVVNRPPVLSLHVHEERIQYDAPKGTVVATVRATDDDTRFATHSEGNPILTIHPPHPNLVLRAPRVLDGGKTYAWDLITDASPLDMPSDELELEIQVAPGTLIDPDRVSATLGDSSKGSVTFFIPPLPPTIELHEASVIHVRLSECPVRVPIRVRDENVTDTADLSVPTISCRGATIPSAPFAFEAKRFEGTMAGATHDLFISEACVRALASGVEVATGGTSSMWDHEASVPIELTLRATDSDGLYSEIVLTLHLTVDPKVRRFEAPVAGVKLKVVSEDHFALMPIPVVQDVRAWTHQFLEVDDVDEANCALELHAEPSATFAVHDNQLLFRPRGAKEEEASYDGAVTLAWFRRGFRVAVAEDVQVSVRVAPSLDPSMAHDLTVDTSETNFHHLRIPLRHAHIPWVVGEAKAGAEDLDLSLLGFDPSTHTAGIQLRHGQPSLQHLHLSVSHPTDPAVTTTMTLPLRIVTHPPRPRTLRFGFDGAHFPISLRFDQLFDVRSDPIAQVTLEAPTILATQAEVLPELSVVRLRKPGPEAFPGVYDMNVRAKTPFAEEAVTRVRITLENDRPAAIEAVVHRESFSWEDAGRVLISEVGRGIPASGIPDAEGHLWELRFETNHADLRWDETARVVVLPEHFDRQPEGDVAPTFAKFVAVEHPTGRTLETTIEMRHVFKPMPALEPTVDMAAYPSALSYRDDVVPGSAFRVPVQLHPRDDDDPSLRLEASCEAAGVVIADQREEDGTWSFVIRASRAAHLFGRKEALEIELRAVGPEGRVLPSDPVVLTLGLRPTFDLKPALLNHTIPVLSGQRTSINLVPLLTQHPDLIAPPAGLSWTFALTDRPPEVTLDEGVLRVDALARTVEVGIEIGAKESDMTQHVRWTLVGTPRVSSTAPNGELGLLSKLDVGPFATHMRMRRIDDAFVRSNSWTPPPEALDKAKLGRCTPRFVSWSLSELYDWFGPGVYVCGTARLCYVSRDAQGAFYVREEWPPREGWMEASPDSVFRVSHGGTDRARVSVSETWRGAGSVSETAYLVRRGDGVRYGDSFVYGPIILRARTQPPKRRGRTEEVVVRSVRAEDSKRWIDLGDDGLFALQEGDPIVAWHVTGPGKSKVSIDGQRLIVRDEAFAGSGSSLRVHVVGETLFGEFTEGCEIALTLTNASTRFVVNGMPQHGDTLVSSNFGANTFTIVAEDAVGVRSLDTSLAGKVPRNAAPDDALTVETDGKSVVHITQGSRFEGQGSLVLTATDLFGAISSFTFVWDVSRARDPPTPPTLRPSICTLDVDTPDAVFEVVEGAELDASHLPSVACIESREDVNGAIGYKLTRIRAMDRTHRIPVTVPNLMLGTEDISEDGVLRYPSTPLVWSNLFASLRNAGIALTPEGRVLLILRIVAFDRDGHEAAYEVPISARFVVRATLAQGPPPTWRIQATRSEAKRVQAVPDVLAALRAHGDNIVAQDDSMIEIQVSARDAQRAIVDPQTRALWLRDVGDALGTTIDISLEVAGVRRDVVIQSEQIPSLAHAPSFPALRAQDLIDDGGQLVVVPFELPLEKHPHTKYRPRKVTFEGQGARVVRWTWDNASDHLTITLSFEGVSANDLFANIPISIDFGDVQIGVERRLLFRAPDVSRARTRFSRRTKEASVRVSDVFEGSGGDTVECATHVVGAPLPVGLEDGGRRVQIRLDEEQCRSDWDVTLTLHARTAFGRVVEPVVVHVRLIAPVRWRQEKLRVPMTPLDSDLIVVPLVPFLASAVGKESDLTFELGSEDGHHEVTPALFGASVRIPNVVHDLHARRSLASHGPRTFEFPLRVTHQDWSTDETTLCVVAEATFGVELAPGYRTPSVQIAVPLCTRFPFAIDQQRFLGDASRIVRAKDQKLWVEAVDPPLPAQEDDEKRLLLRPDVSHAGMTFDLRLAVRGEGTEHRVNLPALKIEIVRRLDAWDVDTESLDRGSSLSIAFVRAIEEGDEAPALPLKHVRGFLRSDPPSLRALPDGASVNEIVAQLEGAGVFEDGRGAHWVLGLDEDGVLYGSKSSPPLWETGTGSMRASFETGRIVARALSAVEPDEGELVERDVAFVLVGAEGEVSSSVRKGATFAYKLSPPVPQAQRTLTFESTEMNRATSSIQLPLSWWFEVREDALERVEVGGLVGYVRVDVDVEARTVTCVFEDGKDAFDGRQFDILLHATTICNQRVSAQHRVHLVPPLDVPRDRQAAHRVEIREHKPLVLDTLLSTKSLVSRWELVSGNRDGLLVVTPDKMLTVDPRASFLGKFDGRRWSEPLLLRAHFETHGRAPASTTVKLTNVVLCPSSTRPARVQIYALPFPDRATATLENPLGEDPGAIYVLGLFDAPDVPGVFEPRLNDVLGGYATAEHMTVTLTIHRAALAGTLRVRDLACMVADERFATFEELGGSEDKVVLTLRVTKDSIREWMVKDARNEPTLHVPLIHLRPDVAKDTITSLPSAIASVRVSANGRTIELGEVTTASENHVRSEEPLFDVERRADGSTRVHARDGVPLLGFFAFDN